MDFLEIDGKTVRVECNFNAICNYMEMRGITDLDFLNTDISLIEWLHLMVASIKEGERLEGRQTDIDAVTIGARPIAEITDILSGFIQIFAKQNGAAKGSKKK